ncbi:hypothetical protein GGR62_002162 [Xanthomonas campestris]|nr:hypothetical protein [Xanthomonas sp. 3075]
MSTRLLSLMGALLLLSGCHRAGDSTATAVHDSTEQVPAAAATDQPAGDVPPATAPAGAFPPQLRQEPAPLARLDGYGDLRFGMDARQARAAWGGDLRGEPATDGGCYLLRPQWADDARRFGFMFEGDRFVRYQTSEAKELAPGGGKVGMTVAQLRALYTAALTEQPHKYVPGALTLRVADTRAPSVLVFDTDADGKVSSWRVGQAPQVDYVEGCG